MIKLQQWLFEWLQKMEHQSTDRGLHGERQCYILENKKDANKTDRRKKVTRSNSLSNTGRQEDCELLSKQPNPSCCLPYQPKNKWEPPSS